MKTKADIKDYIRFADFIKNDPKKVISFCKREIKEYEKLIKILTPIKKL